MADPHSEPPDSDQEPHLDNHLKLYWVQVWRYRRLLRVWLSRSWGRLDFVCHAAWTLSAEKSFKSF